VTLAARSLLLCLLTGSLLFSQDFSHISVERVDAGFRFTSGAVWSREGFLLFSDVPGNQMRKLVPGERSVIFREDTHGASGSTFDAQGRLYTCETRGRRVIRTDKKGKVDVIADKWEGKRLNAPNDIAVRKDGNIYFTDPAFGEQSDSRELDFYGVYHVNPKGVMAVALKPAGRPNGIGFSPNGRILYITNSDDRNVRAYDVDRNGALSNERVAIAKTAGVPGGLCLDEKGNLYVAGKGLQVYSPEGKLLHSFDISENPSGCAFGDQDLMTLYITARGSIYRVRMDVKGAVQH
jgi:gluconolactonase